jgi:hypothetical protein
MRKFFAPVQTLWLGETLQLDLGWIQSESEYPGADNHV